MIASNVSGVRTLNHPLFAQTARPVQSHEPRRATADVDDYGRQGVLLLVPSLRLAVDSDERQISTQLRSLLQYLAEHADDLGRLDGVDFRFEHGVRDALLLWQGLVFASRGLVREAAHAVPGDDDADAHGSQAEDVYLIGAVLCHNDFWLMLSAQRHSPLFMLIRLAFSTLGSW